MAGVSATVPVDLAIRSLADAFIDQCIRVESVEARVGRLLRPTDPPSDRGNDGDVVGAPPRVDESYSWRRSSLGLCAPLCWWLVGSRCPLFKVRMSASTQLPWPVRAIRLMSRCA